MEYARGFVQGGLAPRALPEVGQRGKVVEILRLFTYIVREEGQAMKRIFSVMFVTLAAVLAMPAIGQGRLGLLPQGEYVCALPGTATGAAWNELPNRSFAITGASSYRAGNGSGTYLLEGQRVTFTRGPMKGKQMMRVSSGMLQEIDRDGNLGRLRCHRSGPVLD